MKNRTVARVSLTRSDGKTAQSVELRASGYVFIFAPSAPDQSEQIMVVLNPEEARGVALALKEWGCLDDRERAE